MANLSGFLLLIAIACILRQAYSHIDENLQETRITMPGVTPEKVSLCKSKMISNICYRIY